MNIWDTAGQECFQSIVRSFYRNADAIIIVFSIAKYNILLLFYLNKLVKKVLKNVITGYKKLLNVENKMLLKF